MLSVTALNQYYGGSHILRDVSFELPTGKVTALLGRNGVGKTTLLRTLMGLVRSESGKVMFDGRDLTHAAPYERARSGIGYVPQGREIFPRLTVAENLEMGLATQACVLRRCLRRGVPPGHTRRSVCTRARWCSWTCLRR